MARTVMNKIGFTLLFLGSLLFLQTSCQNFFWSHRCCPEEVQDSFAVCDTYGLTFDVYSDSLLGYLEVENLVSSVGTVGDYVIDWYLNGNIEFSSGTPTSGVADIIYHPFGDSLLVAAGIYTPQIRWIEINDTLYSNDPDSTFYAFDLTDCLPPLTVLGFACDNGSGGTYAWEFDFDWTKEDYDEFATRTITFYIDSTTNYVPWYFDADIVVDRVKVYYGNSGVDTLLATVYAGSDNAGDSYLVDSLYFDNSIPFKRIEDLTGFTYQAGDYVKYVITPSVLQPLELRTIWALGMVCKETLDFIGDCEVIDELANNIDTFSVRSYYDSINCRLIAYFDALAPMELSSDFGTYIGIASNTTTQSGSGGSNLNQYSVDSSYIYANLGISSTQTLSTISTDNLCELNDSAYVTKTGTSFSIQFQDADDYDLFKTRFFATKANIELTWTSDSTQREYYQGYYIVNYVTCADGSPLYGQRWHYLSPYTFDDGTNTFTADAKILTNYMTDVTCSQVYEAVDLYVTLNNNSANLAVSPYYYTGRGGTHTFAKSWVTKTDPVYRLSADNKKDIYEYSMQNVCLPVEFCDEGIYLRYHTHYGIYIHKGYESDPLNNFSIFHFVDADGCSIPVGTISPTTNLPSGGCEVYRISGGVVSYPCTQQR